jgi:hypothetical protein
MYKENDKAESRSGHLNDCCGPAVADMKQICPCASILKRHRLAATLMIGGIALAFAISQVGGILGIIAFARTL